VRAASMWESLPVVVGRPTLLDAVAVQGEVA
jgi:hypothetical protein